MGERGEGSPTQPLGIVCGGLVIESRDSSTVRESKSDLMTSERHRSLQERLEVRSLNVLQAPTPPHAPHVTHLPLPTLAMAKTSQHLLP